MICRLVTPAQLAVSKVMESETPAGSSLDTVIGVEPAFPSGTAGGGVLASTAPPCPKELVSELTSTVSSAAGQEARLQTKEWAPSVGSWAGLKGKLGQPEHVRVSLAVEKNGTDPAGMM